MITQDEAAGVYAFIDPVCKIKLEKQKSHL